jgi:hypothetical protein
MEEKTRFDGLSKYLPAKVYCYRHKRDRRTFPVDSTGFFLNRKCGFNLTQCGLFCAIGAYASGRAEVLKTERSPSKTVHKSVLGALKRAGL